MNEKFLEDANPEFANVCCGCGFALHTSEIYADINGEFTDFSEKVHGSVSVAFCSECWSRFKEMVDSEMSTAIARRRVLESLDKEDKGEVFRMDNNCDNLDMVGDHTTYSQD
jgi:hypothetical protein